ncbi:MAG: Smr/MutS family protein [Anaerolineae bacterium]|nr:Smr/MutS family protein [Anaerolineae bacterium]
MDEKALHILEFDKIRAQLAEHTSFSAGRELALALQPTSDMGLARERLAETAEARTLLEQNTNIHMGGVHDVRPLLPRAERSEILLPADLLSIHSTLARARSIRRTLTRLGGQFSRLANIAARIEPCDALIDEISRCISERGEVLDSASPALARIRSEKRVAHERLMSLLERIVSSPSNAPYLQEPIVTQRQGRYVVPLKAEFKGRIPGLVHDQSASGATLFIEPLAAVELNNRWREKELEEEKEVRRILLELTELVGDEAPYIRRTVEALAELDMIFAKARYAEQLDASEPELVPFRQPSSPRHRRAGGREKNSSSAEVSHPGSVIELRRARHPLLNPDTVVPIDVHLGDDYFILVITGPNTGGKTVTLKTVGLLTLMAQAGMHIPAAPGSRISAFEGVYADIGDEQSIEQSLSTFSSHMSNIIHILDRANEHSLVLLDELGAGTDPEEGSALARALLSHLLQRRITTLATTHYSELKVFAHTTPGVRNASVEFDIETLAPTYELSIGLPGRSNALAIARRLGLDPEIVATAEAMVSPTSLQADALLAEIKSARDEAQARLVEAERRLNAAKALEADLRYRLAHIEEARREVLDEARTIAQAELEEVRAEIERLKRRLSLIQAGGSLHERFLAEAEAELARRAQEVPPLEETTAPEREAVPTGPLQKEDIVWIPSLQSTGRIVELDPEEEMAEVQIGTFRLRLPTSKLELREREPEPAGVAEAVHRPSAPSPGMELDLRGQRVDEMIPRLEKYLDDAYLAGLPWVRIIHGKGTGALRRAVREMLAHHPLVAEIRSGEQGEGGEGVTIARLISQD